MATSLYTYGPEANLDARSLRFSKHHFWLGSEALDDAAITKYLKEDKSPESSKNAAHASQTGEGLLLFSKRVEDKASPVGVINLVGINCSIAANDS